jgi:hypothetical protein
MTLLQYACLITILGVSIAAASMKPSNIQDYIWSILALSVVVVIAFLFNEIRDYHGNTYEAGSWYAALNMVAICCTFFMFVCSIVGVSDADQLGYAMCIFAACLSAVILFIKFITTGIRCCGASTSSVGTRGSTRSTNSTNGGTNSHYKKLPSS